LGERQAKSTCIQILDDVASGVMRKPDMIISSPFERCHQTTAALTEYINDIDTVAGVQQHTTTFGNMMAMREVARSRPSQLDPNKEASSLPMLNYGGFSGNDDPLYRPELGDYFFETVRQGEERGVDTAVLLPHMLGAACSMTDADSRSICPLVHIPPESLFVIIANLAQLSRFWCPPMRSSCTTLTMA
jgi:hypothetical protein